MTRSIDRDEETLDGAQAKVVQRLRRLMIFSSIIMIGGFLVVFGVIAYRLFTMAEPAGHVERQVSLPPGARVLSTAIAEGRLVVTIDVAGAVEIRLFDLTTLEPRGQMRFEPRP